MTIKPGEILQHYCLIEKIGEGGMGIVWKAQDTRLHRNVALKFVPEESAQDSALVERHLREARAASALNHPHICSIHDIGECEGKRFIVMELLEGEPLQNYIGREALKIEEAVELAIQLSDAFDAAHGQGIVHRDIKTANAFVTTRGQIKVLDFGLAKLMPGHAQEISPHSPTEIALDVTQSGTVLGTVSYMSPEQALGKTVDHRSDIFSLGLVIYEMITARRAFEGNSSAAIFDGILNRDPTAPMELNAEVPFELQSIVTKALEKDTKLRYQSMAELLTDLKRLRRDSTSTRNKAEKRSSVTGEEHRTVVVLPFKMLSGGAEYEFLSLALAEAISHALSSNRKLVVRPTSAVTKYSTEAVQPMQVAEELSADVVVEGSIQTLGRDIRVQVQAWDAPAGSTLLSVKLDGTLDDLFGLQDSVAEKLGTGLGVQHEEPLPGLPTPEPRAYEYFLRASERLLRWTQVDTARAIEMLRSAVTLDPQFSDGWGRLAGALVSMGALFDPDSKWFDEAESAIEKALKLNPENPEAWTARGRLLWTPYRGFQHVEAIRYFCQARRHPAHPADAPLWQSTVLCHCGLHDESLSIISEVLEANPDDLLALLIKGEILGWSGDAEAFEESMERAISKDPSFPFGFLFLPVPMLYLDRLEEAEEALRTARGIVGDDTLLLAVNGLLWAKRGETEKANRELAQAMEKQQSVSHAHHTFHYAAAAYAALGEASKAVEVLDQAACAGMPSYTAFSRDPHFLPLHERSDFQTMMARLKADAESLQAEFIRAGR